MKHKCPCRFLWLLIPFATLWLCFFLGHFIFRDGPCIWYEPPTFFCMLGLLTGATVLTIKKLEQ